MILASKQGRVFRVAVDPFTMKSMPISSFDDEPIGAFMMTYTSEGELRQAWPGHEIKFLESPAPPCNKVESLTLEQQRQVDKMLGPTAKPRVIPVAAHTGELLPLVTPQTDTRLCHAEEFLKRLEVAAQYSSKKFQRELEIRIAVVRELINEVFKA